MCGRARSRSLGCVFKGEAWLVDCRGKDGDRARARQRNADVEREGGEGCEEKVKKRCKGLYGPKSSSALALNQLLAEAQRPSLSKAMPPPYLVVDAHITATNG